MTSVVVHSKAMVVYSSFLDALIVCLWVFGTTFFFCDEVPSALSILEMIMLKRERERVGCFTLIVHYSIRCAPLIYRKLTNSILI